MTRLFRVTNPWKQNPLICFISKQVDIEKNSLFFLKSSLKKILQPPCDRLSKWSKSSFLCIHTLEIWCWRSSHKRLSLFLHRLESGLAVWLLLASGTLTSMTQNETWKGLVYWSLLSCCTWILRPSCKWVQASLLEDEKPCGATQVNSLPITQPADPPHHQEEAGRGKQSQLRLEELPSQFRLLFSAIKFWHKQK